MIRFPILLAAFLFGSPSTQARPLAVYATIGLVEAEALAPAVAELARFPAVAYLSIDSPGGSVGVGIEFVDAMRSAQDHGTKIVCTVKDRGMAASMATYILAACDERFMGRQSALMFHTVSVGDVGGNQWDLERVAKYIESLNARMAIFIAGRLSISLAEYRRQTTDRDWWVGLDEAVKIGAVDGVAL